MDTFVRIISMKYKYLGEKGERGKRKARQEGGESEIRRKQMREEGDKREKVKCILDPRESYYVHAFKIPNIV